MPDLGMLADMVKRTGLSGKPGLWLIGVLILGVLETLVFSAGLGAEAAAALAVAAIPLAVLFAYVAVQTGGFWDRFAAEPASAARVRAELADRPLGAGEDADTYARAVRATRADVTPGPDAALALRALLWPNLLACLAIAVVLVLSPGPAPVLTLVVLVVLFPLLLTGFRVATREHLDAVYRAALEQLAEPKYYYCYISRRKLDQLVADTQEAADEQATYGKPGLRQNAAAGRALVARLLVAIRDLENQPGGVPWFDEALAQDRLEPGAYRHRGRHKVLRYDDRFVYLQCGPLRLTCSVAHFSHTTDQDGGLDLHSGNVDFFIGEAEPEFDSIVYLNDVRKLSGTPLYLALPLESRLSL